MSPKILKYKKLCSTQHVITSLIKNQRKKLDQNFIVGAFSTYLSKAYDYIPRDLLVAKLAAYGFHLNTLTLIFTCQKLKTKRSNKQHS